jgi:hypothetical protein
VSLLLYGIFGMEFQPGMLVVARNRIVEEDIEPDPNAGRLEPGWLICEPGDFGIVEDVYECSEGRPDVIFFRSNTVTTCFMDEVAPVYAEA